MKKEELGLKQIRGKAEPNPHKDYYIHNYKLLNRIVRRLYERHFAETYCGEGKTFKRRRYCFGTFLWNMICGSGIKESWKSYTNLIKRNTYE